MREEIFQLLPLCLEASELGAEIIRQAWKKPHNVRHKGETDLVTETDLAVQRAMREELGKLLPEAAFMGEENDGQQSTAASLCWVVDPVDGTTNFVHQIPQVGLSIALCENNRPLLGIINAPMTGECYHALKDGGAYLNGKPIHVSTAEKARDCLVATGFPYEMEAGLETILRHLAAVLPATQGLRRIGAASIDLAYVACGRLDAFYEAGLKPWDMAAGWLLVEEAGGLVTTMMGEPAGFGQTLLASNGHAHNCLLDLLRI